MAARNSLESKNKELSAAKQEKNRIIAALRGKQNKLNTENKNIKSTNNKLISERKRLEAQIQAIIAKEIRERELARQRAEAERIRLAEAERIRTENERRAAEGERSNNNLSGEKPTSGNTGTTSNPPIGYEAPKGSGNLIMPMSGNIVVRYGEEKVQGLTSKGIEIRGSVGQQVKAADSGNVIYSGSLSNLGNVVIIDHGNLITVYGNLSGVSVSKGQKVSKGQGIGTLGRDINREANLYFETRKGVNTVNPMNYL